MMEATTAKKMGRLADVTNTGAEWMNSLYNSSSRALTFPVFLIRQIWLPLMLLEILEGPSTAIPVSETGPQ